MTLNIPTYLPFGFFLLNNSKVTLTGVGLRVLMPKVTFRESRHLMLY